MAGELRRFAAANARVRVLLAGLLGRRGLEMLYGYPTPAALRDALARTVYALPAEAAGTPEHGLSHRLSTVGRAVLGVLPEPERGFLRQYLLHHEVANLKIIIRAVHHRLAWADAAPHLVPLDGIGTIRPTPLAAAHDLRELTDLLDGSPYGPSARAALHRVDAAGPFALEVAVELDYYERLWAAAASLRPTDAARARALLGILFDVLNLRWIARYRDALRLSPEEILNYTLRQGRWITAAVRRELAAHPETPWAVTLTRTPYGPLLADAEAGSFDRASPRLWQFLALEIQRGLSSYPFHIGVPLGFLLAQEIEIRDLAVLFAAKSCGVPSAEALERLASVRH
jgi:V/A-type H+-transporting ATPase subunit C